MSRLVTARALLVAAVLWGCAGTPDAPSDAASDAPPGAPPGAAAGRAARTSLGAATPTDLPGLDNVVVYAPDVICGGAPEGDPGFETLRALGVRSILSVDGAVPDVQAARVHGLRYVHLPIGYDGIEPRRRLELARAVEALPGAIYVHCHHGKHRAAGAAAAALVTLGRMSADDAIELMRVSGTSPDYRGLYACVESASPASDAELAALAADFPEISAPGDLVAAMVRLDAAVEHLDAVERARWSVPDDHPDLVPAALAGEVADLLRNLQDDPSVEAQMPDFAERLAADAALASSIEQGLLDRASPEWLSARFRRLRAACADCHRAHRNDGARAQERGAG